MSSLCLAARITGVAEVLVVYRRRPSGVTVKLRQKDPECFILALLALRDTLLRHELYKELESSYLNYVVHLSQWALRDGLPGKLRVKIEEALTTRLFPKLDIWNKDKTFFHTPSYYAFLQRCRRQKPLAWYENIFSLRNSLDNRYKIIRLCGWVFSLSKRKKRKRNRRVIYAKSKRNHSHI